MKSKVNFETATKAEMIEFVKTVPTKRLREALIHWAYREAAVQAIRGKRPGDPDIITTRKAKKTK